MRSTCGLYLIIQVAVCAPPTALHESRPGAAWTVRPPSATRAAALGAFARHLARSPSATLPPLADHAPEAGDAGHRRVRVLARPPPLERFILGRFSRSGANVAAGERPAATLRASVSADDRLGLLYRAGLAFRSPCFGTTSWLMPARRVPVDWLASAAVAPSAPVRGREAREL